MNDLDKSNLQIPKGSLEDLKAIEAMLNYTIIDISNKEMLEKLFPNQLTLLDKLKQKGLPPEKIKEMCLKEKGVAEKLFKWGLEFESFKKAGILPSSILGMKYRCQFQGYLHDGKIINSQVCSYDLIPEFGFTVEELVKNGIKEKDIQPKYLAEAGYSLEKMKKIGICFRENKKLFSLDKLIENYDLKTLCFGGIDIKKLTEKFSFSKLYAAGYSPRALQKAGANAKTLKELNVPAKKLRRGFRFYDSYLERTISGAFFSVEELKEAGYTSLELKEARISAKKMKNAGFSRNDLKEIFTKKHLDKVYDNSF